MRSERYRYVSDITIVHLIGTACHSIDILRHAVPVHDDNVVNFFEEKIIYFSGGSHVPRVSFR